MISKKIAAGIAAVAIGVLSLTGCGNNNVRDQENIHAFDPDYAENYNNGDGYPNITLVCIRGAGFATTTRQGAGAWRQVHEWDDFCSNFKDHDIVPSQERQNG